MLLASIHKDHNNINRLLQLLTEKLSAIRAEKDVNYSLIRDVVVSLQEHAEKYHHPKEDLIYHYYIEHYVDAERVAALDDDHQALAELTADFALTIEMVLMDAVIPLDVFADKLNGFVMTQRAHLELEETSVLPVIERAMTTGDWDILQARWDEDDHDPLFGKNVSAKFKELAASI
ncbi:hypothetical protein A1OW_17115 [Enterovibrio norvegicus]|uniref:hemerythrin domain-containing protein n=1 Tax=Enterovibrio norvegicus TaxID=188144 RepID=UPI0002DB6D70|nr:hemerythrin domain-containing protein [Enterovibrio norvegicus]OEF64738.1 hypothetical protein A1OW_17115 [Enterovibrio norvegicus]